MSHEKDLGADAAVVDTARSAEAVDPASHAAPWKAVNHPYQGCLGDTLDDWCVEDATGERIVEVYKSDGLDEPRAFPAKERAHLIAAAPEMKAALLKVVPLCDALNELMADSEEMRARVMALLIKHGLQDDYGYLVAQAIAKAEGK